MDPRAELRREPPADLSDVGSDEALVDRIRDEIRRTGPMPFARFMELALYDPEGGYYRGPAARPGRAGDFLTAPELHPIFGASPSRRPGYGSGGRRRSSCANPEREQGPSGSRSSMR